MKKLIEVALPLEAINFHAAKEKSIRHGHPSTLHLWWARRPLAACRAVLFAQMVDDPQDPAASPEFVAACNDLPKGKNSTLNDTPRHRLFDLIEQLVEWENSNNEDLLKQANHLIRLCAGANGPPPVLDPFAGGGSIPLEAQRLGLTAYASDLNPVAVLINKALIELPPQFANCPPIHPNQEARLMKQTWRGAQGLAEDVRYYGHWMREQAQARIGHLYPTVTITAELLSQRPDLKAQGLKVDQSLTVIAWLWARTVPSPNPATNGTPVPLIKSFWLSTKKGKETWLEPIVDRKNLSYRFEVRTGTPTVEQTKINNDGTMHRQGGICLLTNVPMPFEHIREQGRAERMGARLMAIVADGPKGRVYLSPMEEHDEIAKQAVPAWKPDGKMEGKAAANVPLYGMTTFGDLFTPRQLTALSTFSNLVTEAHTQVKQDSLAKGLTEEQALNYANAVATYLAFAVDKGADYWSTICSWHTSRDLVRNTFGRQAIAMIWDFAEANPLSQSAGNFYGAIEWIVRVLEPLFMIFPGQVMQHNVMEVLKSPEKLVISTDPPYYDNIEYADLADFFYVWLQHSLKTIYPQLFSTLLVPKVEELVATPYRFDSKKTAMQFFQDGLEKVFVNLRQIVHLDYPMTVYYAFKQTETTQQNDETVSTGWETMLEGLIQSGFTITGTWPIKTELGHRAIASGTNALASSIVLVCRPRPADAPIAGLRDFVKALKRELPKAIRDLQQSNIAPVDLAQASIGPGMAIYSRYRHILNAEGTPMPVRTALTLINQALDECLAEQEIDFEAETRWALAWYGQYGFEEGPYGVAETLSKAKNISVDGLADTEILQAVKGKVNLIARDQYPPAWKPRRPTTWGVMQYLIKQLTTEKDEDTARWLANHARGYGELARELAYQLYNLCERKNWAAEATAYNTLIVSWPELQKLMARQDSAGGEAVQLGIDS